MLLVIAMFPRLNLLRLVWTRQLTINVVDLDHNIAIRFYDEIFRHHSNQLSVSNRAITVNQAMIGMFPRLKLINLHNIKKSIRFLK